MRNLLLLLGLFSASIHATPVNINRADAKTIADSLAGVGMKKAEAIVAYRMLKGPFQTVDDLKQIVGIGKKVVEANRADILLTEQAIATPNIVAISATAIVTPTPMPEIAQESSNKNSIMLMAAVALTIIIALWSVLSRLHQKRKLKKSADLTQQDITDKPRPF